MSKNHTCEGCSWVTRIEFGFTGEVTLACGALPPVPMAAGDGRIMAIRPPVDGGARGCSLWQRQEEGEVAKEVGKEVDI